MKTSKDAFCAANSCYGYGRVVTSTQRDGANQSKLPPSLAIDQIRPDEFPQLISTSRCEQSDFDESKSNNSEKNAGDVVYLDHAGATLYAQSQLNCVFDVMKNNLFGNPHTQGAISQTTRTNVVL
jgi:hypothetical protein